MFTFPIWNCYGHWKVKKELVFIKMVVFCKWACWRDLKKGILHCTGFAGIWHPLFYHSIFYLTIDYIQSFCVLHVFEIITFWLTKLSLQLSSLHQITRLIFDELSLKMESVWESLNITLPRNGDIIAFWQTVLWYYFQQFSCIKSVVNVPFCFRECIHSCMSIQTHSVTAKALD